MDYIDALKNIIADIRLQPARYTPGWDCLLMYEGETAEEAYEYFEDLVGGDHQWIEALAYLRNEENNRINPRFVFVSGDEPIQTLGDAYMKALDHLELFLPGKKPADE